MTTSLPRPDRIRRAIELLRNETTDKFDKDGLTNDAVQCPRCGGKLRYGANQNGRRMHLIARCETPNCLEFMT